MKKHVLSLLLCWTLAALTIANPYYALAEDASEDGMFYVCINSGINVDADGFAAVNIENDSRNQYFMKVEIMVNLSENPQEAVLLAETPFLAPGDVMENMQVQSAVSKGEYRGEAIFYAFDKSRTGNSLGNVNVDITLSVPEDVTGTNFAAVGAALSNVYLNAECSQQFGKINIGLSNGSENLYSFEGEIVDINNGSILAETPLLNPGEALDYVPLNAELDEDTQCLLQLHFYSEEKDYYIGTGGKQMLIFKR